MFNNFLEQERISMIFIDEDGTIVDCNDIFESTMTISKENFCGKTIEEIGFADQSARLLIDRITSYNELGKKNLIVHLTNAAFSGKKYFKATIIDLALHPQEESVGRYALFLSPLSEKQILDEIAENEMVKSIGYFPYSAPISEEIISSICTASFNAVMDETVGPSMFASSPSTFSEHEKTMMLIVRQFSAIDMEYSNYIGHRFLNVAWTYPPSEVIGIIFSVPNLGARGGVELHGLSIVINRSYENAMNFSMLQLRTTIFMHHERIKEILFAFDGSIALSSSVKKSRIKELKKTLEKVLEQLREDSARVIAGVIGIENLKSLTEK
ncbi:MAG: hypothetical protein ACTSYA_03030 [Candidatus Kariarchaeaceae archaeon]